MADNEALWRIVENLVDVPRLEAKQTAEPVTRGEQLPTRTPETHRSWVIVSGLAQHERRSQSPSGELERAR